MFFRNTPVFHFCFFMMIECATAAREGGCLHRCTNFYAICKHLKPWLEPELLTNLTCHWHPCHPLSYIRGHVLSIKPSYKHRICIVQHAFKMYRAQLGHSACTTYNSVSIRGGTCWVDVYCTCIVGFLLFICHGTAHLVACLLHC